MIISNTKSIFQFYFTEWFKASDSNICYITYAYEHTKKEMIEGFLTAQEMITSHRMHHAAKVIRVLLWTVHKQCRDENIPSCNLENTLPNKVTMLGQSFGAYVAAQACLYIKKAFNGELVGILIGIDPFGITALAFAYNQPMMARGQAVYVQVKHLA